MGDKLTEKKERGNNNGHLLRAYYVLNPVLSALCINF